MTPSEPQRPDTPRPRERPTLAARAAVASTRSPEPASPVTAYDEIWFQGRPQLP